MECTARDDAWLEREDSVNKERIGMDVIPSLQSLVDYPGHRLLFPGEPGWSRIRGVVIKGHSYYSFSSAISSAKTKTAKVISHNTALGGILLIICACLSWCENCSIDAPSTKETRP